jgi:acyl-CoA synthetase (AMP-forming)/AMP-acid ligase II
MVQADVTDHVLTVPALLDRAVAAFGEREAVVMPDDRMTFDALAQASRRLAGHLAAAGVGRGTRVGAQFSYGAEWLVSFLAVTAVGGVLVPLSTAYKAPELRTVARHADLALLLSPSRLFDADRFAYLESAFPDLADSVAGALFVESAPFLRAIWVHGEALRPWANPIDARGAGAPSSAISDDVVNGLAEQVSPADDAVIIYTSGTTAAPKGVRHTHGALTRKAIAQADLKGSTAEERVFCGMPFFWVGGLVQGVMGALASGFTLLCLEKPDPGPALDLMEREGATRIIGWPGVTGPIMRDRADRKIPALRDLPKRSGLGMTETLAGYSSSASVGRIPPREPGTCMGKVNPGVEIAIVDPTHGDELPRGESGAIFVRGYPLMDGLVKHERDEVFSADGWYDTGDKGHFADDLLFFEGRIKEMIKTSGNNVAPPEVEVVLETFAAVAEAHVLGVPDEERGEIVAAAVVASSGFTVDPEALSDHAREQLSNYKVPRKIIVVDRIPLLANGKPDRLAIRALLVDG